MVAIGGGTGLSTLLKGLKKYTQLGQARPLSHPPIEVTAIVTVTDDGGSSGRLRRDFGILPPGDIRNCMVALAEDEALLTKLFQFRFDGGRGLKGHSFGNLFLTVLTQITGDFTRAVTLSSEVLAIAGNIYPSTNAPVALRATLADGSQVEGESRISRSRLPIERIALEPGGCRPLGAAIEALRAADLITLGPGSLYTSVIPNLLVRGITKAIAESRAIKAYFVNLMSQPGETTGLSATEHLLALESHSRCRLVDYAIVNNAPIAAPARRRYARQEATPVHADVAELRDMGFQVVEAPLVAHGSKIRHDPERIAEIALQLAKKGRRLSLMPSSKDS